MKRTLLAVSAFTALFIGASVPAGARDIETARKFCNLATRDPLQAIENCSELLKSSNPTDKRDAYTNRGRGYLVHGWLDNALSDFNEAIKLDSKWATAYNNRAVAYRQLGRFQEAIADHDRALSMERNNDLFLRARENTLKKMGQ